MTVMHNPLHPGEIVKEDFDASGLTVTQAAKRLGVSRTALSRLLNGHSGISPEMALRLAKFFGTSVDMWINLQARYDIWQISKRYNKIKVQPLNKAA